MRPGPGPALSAEDHRRIDELALAMKRPSASRIAQRIGRNLSTVYWYMLRAGLVETIPRKTIRPYERCGVKAAGFEPREDALILELRATLDARGKPTPFRAIAETINRAFGKSRSANGVQVRNVILAARKDDEP